MSDPLRQLHQQPWGAAIQGAVLAVVLAVSLEGLMYFAIAALPGVKTVQDLLYGPSLGIVMQLVVAIGLGAGAIALFMVLNRSVQITSGVLWTFLACLIGVLWLREGLFTLGILPIQPWFTALSMNSILGILVGAAWRSWPHWRY